MKKFILILGLSVVSSINAQQNTVASGGDANGSGGSVSYSLGQIDYQTNSGSNGIVTQGNQQPYEIYLAELNELYSTIAIDVFPNPTTSIINIVVDAELSNSVWTYELVDLNGKLISTSPLKSKETQIDLHQLATNQYFLNILIEGSKAKTYKIVRSN